MKKKEIIEQTERLEKISDRLEYLLFVQEYIPCEEDRRNLKAVRYRYCKTLLEVNEKVKEHPEMKQVPWIKNYYVALRKFEKISKKFEVAGMPKKEVSLIRKFKRGTRINEILINLCEKILKKQRESLSTRERIFLGRIKERVRRTILSGENEMKPGDSMGESRWKSGIQNNEIQILQNIGSVLEAY